MSAAGTPLDLDALEKACRGLIAADRFNVPGSSKFETWCDADEAFTEAATPEAVLRLIEERRELLEMLSGALAVVDAADKACPVNRARPTPDRCPKCRASSAQNCGPNVTALDRLSVVVRAALAKAEGRANG